MALRCACVSGPGPFHRSALTEPIPRNTTLRGFARMTFDRSPIVRMRRIAYLATAGAMLVTSALAQTTPAPKPPAAKPAPPAAPVQPGAPQPGAPAAQTGPSVVQVKPEPSQSDWLKVCGKDPSAGKE